MMDAGMFTQALNLVHREKLGHSNRLHGKLIGWAETHNADQKTLLVYSGIHEKVVTDLGESVEGVFIYAGLFGLDADVTKDLVDGLINESVGQLFIKYLTREGLTVPDEVWDS